MKDYDIRILLVDGSVVVTKFIAVALEKLGEFSFEEARDGVEALQKLKTDSNPDLIITNIDMPQMDGIEFYKQTLKKYDSMADRFLFITGNYYEEEVTSFLEENNLKYLMKPFRVDDLRKVVNESMEQDNN